MDRIRKRDIQGRYIPKKHKTIRLRIDEDLYQFLTVFREKALSDQIKLTESDLANVILSIEFNFFSEQDIEDYYQENILARIKNSSVRKSRNLKT